MHRSVCVSNNDKFQKHFIIIYCVLSKWYTFNGFFFSKLNKRKKKLEQSYNESNDMIRFEIGTPITEKS